MKVLKTEVQSNTFWAVMGDDGVAICLCFSKAMAHKIIRCISTLKGD